MMEPFKYISGLDEVLKMLESLGRRLEYMTIELNSTLIKELNQMEAEALVAWAFDNFGERAALGTSFQLTGSVIFELASHSQKNFRVFTVDTGRLHPETLEMIQKVKDKDLVLY